MAKSAQVQSARDHYAGKRAGIRHRSHSVSQLASDGIGYVVACVCVATSVACQVFLEPHALTVEETLGRLGTEDALFGGVAYLASKVRGSPSLTLERIQELGLPTQPFAEFGLFGIQ
jgi:hypothetical protein